MYRLTERRLKKALPILEEYRNTLHTKRWFNAWMLDTALQKCWNIGYRELKGIMIDMLANQRFRFVAIYYMENCNHGSGVISEFRPHLVKSFGLRHWNSGLVKNASKDFWEKFKLDNGIKESDN